MSMSTSLLAILSTDGLDLRSCENTVDWYPKMTADLLELDGDELGDTLLEGLLLASRGKADRAAEGRARSLAARRTR